MPWPAYRRQRRYCHGTLQPHRADCPGIVDREPESTRQTGLKSIDAMIPVGRGQRELIIGDRQTGKMPSLYDTITPEGRDLICIYVARGQALHRRPVVKI